LVVRQSGDLKPSALPFDNHSIRSFGILRVSYSAARSGSSILLREAQRFVSLLQRPDDEQDTSKGQCSPDASNKIPPPCGIRGFFRRNGGAPLGAQIGILLVFAAVTSCGMYVGLGRLIESRRHGWFYLCGGLAAYALFMWWSSPNYS
jgi:hypothetical protein